jgi:hypothetical protein
MASPNRMPSLPNFCHRIEINKPPSPFPQTLFERLNSRRDFRPRTLQSILHGLTGIQISRK